MSRQRCLVIGAGRMAGGFVAPLFHDAGWDVTLACRNADIHDAINGHGGVALQIGASGECWIDRIDASSMEPAALGQAIARADMLATAAGPSALVAIGRALAPAMRDRLDRSGRPLNIVTFENHRRGAERFAAGLVDADPTLASEIGRRIGIGGAAVWRVMSRRETTPAGLLFVANAEDTCYIDGLSLLPSAPPHDGSLPGATLVGSFDDRMVEKLWIFNAGHCAAAYLGWHAGCATLDEALRVQDVRSMVAAVIEETRLGLAAYLASRPGSTSIEPPSTETILAHYADPTLADPVVRVAREPRRKLARDDRLIGAALACTATGSTPTALVNAAAAALAYAETSDGQAGDLQRELSFLEPEEVLGSITQLDPADELLRLICADYRERIAARDEARR